MAQALVAERQARARAPRCPRLPAFAEHWFNLPDGSFPFSSRFLQINNCQLHCVDEGRGPVLFMLHGNPTWSFQFRHLIRALRPAYRCIALDLPGFGLSGAPPGFSFRPADIAALVAEAMRALDLRDATLVAQDWGGPIGLAAMAEEAGRVGRIVFGNTWAWPVDGDLHFEWFSKLVGGPLGRLLGTPSLISLNLLAARRDLSPADRLAYQAPFAGKARRAPLHVLPAELLRSSAWLAGVERAAARFAGPALLLWSDNDVAFRRRELDRWRRLWPQAQVQPVLHGGHSPWEEAPDACLAALRPFLALSAPLPVNNTPINNVSAMEHRHVT